MQLPGVIAFSFRSIAGFAAGEIAVLRVIERQMPDPEGRRELAGVFYRGMVLFNWTKAFGFGIEAKGLVQQPVGIPNIFLYRGMAGLVAAAHQPPVLCIGYRKTELLRLGKMDIEKGDRPRISRISPSARGIR